MQIQGHIQKIVILTRKSNVPSDASARKGGDTFKECVLHITAPLELSIIQTNMNIQIKTIMNSWKIGQKQK